MVLVKMKGDFYEEVEFFSSDVLDASLIAVNQVLERIGKLEASENPGYASRKDSYENNRKATFIS